MTVISELAAACHLFDHQELYVHALGAARYPPALLHAVKLATAVGIRLALHVVIVVIAAPGADEERGGEERRGAGTDLLDLGDGVREGGGVVVELVVEPGIADVVSLLLYVGERAGDARRYSIGSARHASGAGYVLRPAGGHGCDGWVLLLS